MALRQTRTGTGIKICENLGKGQDLEEEQEIKIGKKQEQGARRETWKKRRRKEEREGQKLKQEEQEEKG